MSGPLELPRALDGLLRPLTPRQQEVVRLVGAGLNGPEIAASLHIGIDATRMHINNIADLLPNPRLLPPMRLVRQWAVAQEWIRQGREPADVADPTT